MYVGYCQTCLPTKTVLGWSTVQRAVKDILHSDHADANEDGLPDSTTATFELNESEWTQVYNADINTTVTNITTDFGDRFV